MFRGTMLVMALVGLYGCPRPEMTEDSDTDGAPDSDMDTDTEADVDADTDSDVDSDTDADSDTGASGMIDLGTADAMIVGEEDGDSVGGVIAVGDQDGDDCEDVVVVAKRAGAASGAYVVLGPVGGIFDLSVADAVITPAYDGSLQSVAVGDLGGDGVGDILVGSMSAHSAGGYETGAAFLVYGSVSGTLDLTVADAVLWGEAAGDEAGNSVSIGDLNDDGIGDAIIGALDEHGNSGHGTGSAYIVSGPVTGEIGLSYADAKLVGEEVDDNAGTVVLIGEVDGDGVGDALVGAPALRTDPVRSGAIYIVMGPVSGTIDLSSAEAKLIGGVPSFNDGLGQSIATGDVSGDGYYDILAGAVEDVEGGDDAGAAYLFLGPFSGDISVSAAEAKLTGSEGDSAGCSAAVGDVDGDNLEDLLIGAENLDDGGSRGGGAFLLSGPVAGSHLLSKADVRFVAENGGDQAGYSVALGDVDGDLLMDPLVGAPWAYYDSGEPGIVYLFKASSLFQ